MRRIFFIIAVWATFSAPSAFAQNWVASLFPEFSFDAGTVARGSKIRHSFRLVNRLDQEVHISTWKTKCGCTDVRVGSQTIPPGTQTTIEAVIDTTRFEGVKHSGLTLFFDRPVLTQFDLNFSCFIRGDITLNPGGVDFGIVTRSVTNKPSIAVNLAYNGGQQNWGITKMKTQSPNVRAELQEQSRSGSGQVQYLLTATLDPSALNGFTKDEITLYTNDPTGPVIPISVTATVQSAVTVTPSPLVIGPIKAGQVVKKTVMVRSSQPFLLNSVKAGKNDVLAAPDTEGSLALHRVTLTFKAPTQPGPYNATVEFQTDLKDEPPAKLTAFATIIP